MQIIDIAVDDSNGGKFPTIYVGAVSSRRQDSVLSQTPYINKKTGKVITRRQGIDFRYILFSRYDADIVGYENFPVVAACRFADYFANSGQSVRKLIVDGEMSSSQKLIIERVASSKNPNLELIVEVRADEKSLLCNESDAIARKLHRYHSTRGRRRKTMYVDHLISSEIERYADNF